MKLSSALLRPSSGVTPSALADCRWMKGSGFSVVVVLVVVVVDVVVVVAELGGLLRLR